MANKLETKKLILNDSLEQRSVELSTAYNSGHSKENDKLSYQQMSYILFEIAGPAVVSQLIMYLQEVMNTIFGGHNADPDILAAIGLGNMTQNMLLVDVI